MKKVIFIFTFGLMFILAGLIFTRKDDVITIINTHVNSDKQKVELGEVNEYFRPYDFNFVQNTDNFSPENKQDILNIFYTVINAGKDEFTFYCPSDYEECLVDVQGLANDQDTLSDINNYVHPFNSFSHIATEYDNLGKVTISINKTYSSEEITAINSKVDELNSQLFDSNLSYVDNIKKIHDFIINNTKYDSARSDNNDTTFKSDTAYGPLFQGYAICGGYTDLMQLFFERMYLKSFRVSSNMHVWNAVLIDDVWYNIDLTWDDPVSDDGYDYLQHTYFMVSTSKLLEQEKEEHNFDMEHYSELKEA